ncbi:MAG: 5-(carboxyamino)imidazole ribonucleotide synthase [Bryobacteraceae bacterium]|nr:5-(carboxyamino)imidazole ribonucleotide synthase [Bryobacteraceae bacterium]
MIILPGRTLGILGSGQLGRMLGIAAREMGYRVHVYSSELHSPAGAVADREFVGAYDDIQRVSDFARTVDVLTFEFENVAAECAAAAEAVTLVRPAGRVLHITQNRIREKSFLRDAGIPVTPFRPVYSADDLAGFTYPAVLKTAAFGYDGKGQQKVTSEAQARDVFASLPPQPLILEEFIPFRREVSVVAGRGVDGDFYHFGVMENAHANHILDVSRGPVAMEGAPVEIARQVFDALDAVGVMCVEFFETVTGEYLVNEIAPRTHNSGHLTIEACNISQFELQLRLVCGLPAPVPEYLVGAGAMANLLGDQWESGEPQWAAALAAGAKLHLYGKHEPRPGRKMGHLTALASHPDAAAKIVTEARRRLSNPTDSAV